MKPLGSIIVTRQVLDFHRAALRTEESAVGARHLVRPNGSYDAYLLLALYDRFFRPSWVFEGVTCDPSCVFISTLTGSGFDDKTAIWLYVYYQYSSIRTVSDDKKPSTPLKDLDSSLLVLQANWVRFLIDSTVAADLVIFGKANRLFLRKP